MHCIGRGTFVDSDPILSLDPQSFRLFISKMNRVLITRTAVSAARRHAANATRLSSSKVFPSAAAAVEDIKSGNTLLVGGFGLCGIPENLIAAVKASGPT